MSGGAFEYAYEYVTEMATDLKDFYDNPLWHEFADHLTLVAKAMREIEWVASGDNHEGDEREAIEVCIGKN